MAQVNNLIVKVMARFSVTINAANRPLGSGVASRYVDDMFSFYSVVSIITDILGVTFKY